MKWHFKYSSPAKIAIAITILICTISSSNLNWSGKSWQGIVEADAKGYYAYLPAVFIYSDLEFGFYDEMEGEGGKYYNPNYHYDYRVVVKQDTINKYYSGTALAQLPFFLIAHGVASASSTSADGYSKPYSVLINIAAIVYLLIGLLALNAWLRHFKVGEWNRAITMLVLVFATNLYYYTCVEPGMSHIYSFAFASLFVLLATRYFEAPKFKTLLLGLLCLGMIILIRPVNGILVFSLPFLAGSGERLKTAFRAVFQKPVQLLTAFVGLLLIISIQLIIYKASTGQFWVYAYGEEGFNFGDPHILDILFSYKKGLFLYTPVLLFSMVGLIYYWRAQQFCFWSWLLFFGLITYVLSSWWNWWYGGSFSSRVYVEYLPFFGVLLAILLKMARKPVLRITTISILLLFTVFCQFQIYQYRYYLIHWEDMTKEQYWKVFLSMDKDKALIQAGEK